MRNICARFYLTALVCMVSSTAFAERIPNQNKFSEGIDQHGVGLGLIWTGSSGGALYYDFNIPHISKQAHFQYESASDERASILGLNKMELKQTALHGSLRHVYDSGWYFGLVLGWFNTTLRMNQLGSTAAQKDQSIYFYERGLIAGPEFGWQGNDFYYFTVGLRGLGRNKLSDHYELEEMYDISNQRETASELWKQGKQYSGIYIGFGWYFNTNSDNSRQTDRNNDGAQKVIDSQTIEKARKCQSKGGIWVNDMCRLEVE
jgi:hypothetical protein